MLYGFEGDFIDADGTSKKIDGLFDDFDPSYRFDQIGSTDGALYDYVTKVLDSSCYFNLDANLPVK